MVVEFTDLFVRKRATSDFTFMVFCVLYSFLNNIIKKLNIFLTLNFSKNIKNPRLTNDFTSRNDFILRNWQTMGNKKYFTVTFT